MFNVSARAVFNKIQAVPDPLNYMAFSQQNEKNKLKTPTKLFK